MKLVQEGLFGGIDAEVQFWDCSMPPVKGAWGR